MEIFQVETTRRHLSTFIKQKRSDKQAFVKRILLSVHPPGVYEYFTSIIYWIGVVEQECNEAALAQVGSEVSHATTAPCLTILCSLTESDNGQP